MKSIKYFGPHMLAIAGAVSVGGVLGFSFNSRIATASPLLATLGALVKGSFLGEGCSSQYSCSYGQWCGPIAGETGNYCCIPPGGGGCSPTGTDYCCQEAAPITCNATTLTCCVANTNLTACLPVYPPGAAPLQCDNVADCCLPTSPDYQVLCTSAYDGTYGWSSGRYCVQVYATGQTVPGTQQNCPTWNPCLHCPYETCQPGTTTCCVPLGDSCAFGETDCCENAGGGANVCGLGKTCCAPGGLACTNGSQCCSGVCNTITGLCGDCSE
jgi:hypothetical protein